MYFKPDCVFAPAAVFETITNYPGFLKYTENWVEMPLELRYPGIKQTAELHDCIGMNFKAFVLRRRLHVLECCTLKQSKTFSKPFLVVITSGRKM